MNFSQFVATGATAVVEGAVLERLTRDPAVEVDPHILNGGLIYDARGRALLAEIHGGYARSAREAGLPILLFTDTWRCNRSRLSASRFRGRPVNEDNASFLLQLRATFAEGPSIFVGGLLGPSGDAYKPEDSLDRQSARDFHRPQVEALASAGVDFLHLATAPSVEEALGVADAMAEPGLSYMISFVIRRDGVVLDGTPLGEAIELIDTQAARPPIGFSVNCVHARILETALEAVAASHPNAAKRLLVFQANTADKDVEELDGSAKLHTEPPEAFADGLMRMRRRFGLRMLGGCCGTNGEHIAALTSMLRCEISRD